MNKLKEDAWASESFAQQEKRRRREREKKRRQRAMLALRLKQPVVVRPKPRLYEMFETSSGMKAVTVRMLNSLWITHPGQHGKKVPLSMPYVEFLHGPAR